MLSNVVRFLVFPALAIVIATMFLQYVSRDDLNIEVGHQGLNVDSIFINQLSRRTSMDAVIAEILGRRVPVTQDEVDPNEFISAGGFDIVIHLTKIFNRESERAVDIQLERRERAICFVREAAENRELVDDITIVRLRPRGSIDLLCGTTSLSSIATDSPILLVSANGQYYAQSRLDRNGWEIDSILNRAASLSAGSFFLLLAIVTVLVVAVVNLILDFCVVWLPRAASWMIGDRTIATCVAINELRNRENPAREANIKIVVAEILEGFKATAASALESTTTNPEESVVPRKRSRAPKA